MDNKTLKRFQDKGITILDPRNTYIGPGVRIARGNTIYPNTFLISSTTNTKSKKARITIGPKNTIGPNVHIEGSVTIGSNNTISYSHISDSKIGNLNKIGPYSRLRNKVILGNNINIGNFVEIKNSTIKDGSQIAHLSYIGDAIIGKDVNIGAGTITANFNSVTRKKTKTIIHDCAATGANSVLVAPVEIGKDTIIAAGSTITENVPSKSLAIARQKQINKKNWVKK